MFFRSIGRMMPVLQEGIARVETRKLAAILAAVIAGFSLRLNRHW
jgi:hypothetical protein